MITLTYSEPFIEVQLNREHLLAKGYTDSQMAQKLEDIRFDEALATANLTNNVHVFIAVELTDEPHPLIDNVDWEVMIWKLSFPDRNHAMLFKLAYMGDLKQR